jgi:type IV pilus assembly protein PilC
MLGRSTSALAVPALNRQGSAPGTPILERISNIKVEFGPSRKDILAFTNQLAVMVRAGISLPEALESIACQTENQRFRRIIERIKTDIESGMSLSSALAQHPNVFNNLYVNMVAAAEVSGSLGEMLQKLAEYLDQEAATRSQVKGAMVYPVIIATMAVLVTIFLLCFILPRFMAIFAGKEHLLPRPTRMLMAASTFMRSNWYFLVPAVFAAGWGFYFFINTAYGRTWWDMVKLRLPLRGKLCRCLYITRTLHTMGVLVRAGVPILNTLAITAQIAGHTQYRRMWLSVHNDVKQGKKIAEGLARWRLLPSGVHAMIRSGEESGNLGQVLRDISAFYSRELATIIKVSTSMIEPIMIVAMGLLVGFIAMSIILPIFKMSSLVMGK